MKLTEKLTNRSGRHVGLALLLLALLLLALLIQMLLPAAAFASTPQESSGGRKLIVYTSFFPLEDLARRVAGGGAEVRPLLRTGETLQTWQPDEERIAALRQADVLFVNGSGLEPWLDNLKVALPELKIVCLSEGYERIRLPSETGESDYQYRAVYQFGDGRQSMEFGHTHEPSLLVGFVRKDALTDDQLDQRGRVLLATEAARVAQGETLNVVEGQIYELAMGHESGCIYLQFPTAGEWVVYADCASSPNLPYLFVDRSDQVLTPQVELTKADEDLQIDFDPHCWLALSGARHYAKKIGRTLAGLDESLAEIVKENRSLLNKELKALDERYADLLETAPLREFVVAQPCYAYLAREYRLKQQVLAEGNGVSLPLCSMLDMLSCDQAGGADYLSLSTENLACLAAALVPSDSAAGHEPSMLEDIYLEDWEGSWNSLGSYLELDALQPRFSELAAAEGRSVDEYKADCADKRRSDFAALEIVGDTVTFYDAFATEGGQPIGSGQYAYTGTYKVKHGRFDKEWHAFRSDSASAPYPHLLLMPVHGEDSLPHFHMRYGEKLEPLLVDEKWYPTFVIPRATAAQLIKGFTE